MGIKEVHYCDFCKKEFESPGKTGEPLDFFLRGRRYTDSAGSIDQNIFKYEAHKKCWEHFFSSFRNNKKF